VRAERARHSEQGLPRWGGSSVAACRGRPRHARRHRRAGAAREALGEAGANLALPNTVHATHLAGGLVQHDLSAAASGEALLRRWKRG
jgi:hypothetical protein